MCPLNRVVRVYVGRFPSHFAHQPSLQVDDAIPIRNIMILENIRQRVEVNERLP